MQNLNPFAAPAAEMPLVSAPPRRLSLPAALGVVLASAVIGALLGMGLGAVIGLLLPDYYRAVFDDATLNPLQVGMGLGLTQGLGVGLLIGVCAMFAVALSMRRR